MKTEMDTLEKIGKVSYKVPEGYFDDLRGRLEAIPAGKAAQTGVWIRVRPYLAMAASFVAVLILGNAILKETAHNRQPLGGLDQSEFYADMISLTHPETLLHVLDNEQEDLSDEDIINYLIETGAGVELIAYAPNQ